MAENNVPHSLIIYRLRASWGSFRRFNFTSELLEIF